ncbi:MAG: HutD family protein [Caldimonas sp.]
MSGARIATLDPSGYGRTAWKNGGGVAIDIAGESRPGPASIGWDATLWRFGRTTISTGGPYSDLTGFDRLQMVVAGRGLVLQTPAGEIDVREPFVAVRFRGEPAIVSRLESGPVEVVNLIAARSHAAIDLGSLAATQPEVLKPGRHVIYAPLDACALRCGGTRHELAADHALRVDCDNDVVIECLSGRALVASIFLA